MGYVICVYSERIINSWWIFQGFDLTQKEFRWSNGHGWDPIPREMMKTWEHIFLLVEVQRICFFLKLWGMGDGGQIWRSDSLSFFLEEWQLQGASWTAPCCNPSLWQSKVLISKIDHLHCLPYISLALNQDSPKDLCLNNWCWNLSSQRQAWCLWGASHSRTRST